MLFEATSGLYQQRGTKLTTVGISEHVCITSDLLGLHVRCGANIADGTLQQHPLDLHEYLVDPTIVHHSVDMKNDIRDAMGTLQKFLL